jgi:ectoine hydroxylase-related dioxygenase (phytanoyl-CoA dioxygenase family)
LLSEEQLRDYERDGFVLVRGLITPEEADVLRTESHDLIGRLSDASDPTWASARELAGGATTSLQHSHDAQFYAAAFSKMLVDERFTSVAGQVIGTPNVQLHHTKMFVKPPEKGSPFPMHQDHPFFPHTYHRMAAAIFFLDDATEEKGCVRVVPGSYKNGPLQHIQEGSYHLPTDEWPVEKSVPVPAKAGDVIFFSYLTVHGSGVNTSNEARTTWLVQFRDPADPPLTDAHSGSLGQGMMLAGIDPTARGRAGTGAKEPAMSGAGVGGAGSSGGMTPGMGGG